VSAPFAGGFGLDPSPGGGLRRFASPRWYDSLIFVLLLSGPPQLRVRDAAASLRGELDAVAYFQLGVWGLGLLWILVRLYPYLIDRGMAPRLGAPQLLAGLLVVALSLGILISPGPALTAFSIYQLTVMLGFAWMFVQLYGPESCVRHLFWGYLLLGIAIVVAWIAAPEMVVARERLRGDLIGPAGALGAMGLLVCLSGVLRLRVPALLAVCTLFSVLLIASQTRTALAAFLVTLPLGWVFSYSAPVKKVFPLAVVSLLLAGILDILATGQQYAIREEQSLTTLSDRLPLWDHLLGTMLNESPVIGLGYYAASRVLGPQYNPGLGNAHSAFVEILVGGGLLGGLFFFCLYATLFFYGIAILLHGRRSPLGFAALGLFAITFLMSLTITDGIQNGPVGFTFWSVTALLPAIWTRLREIRHASRRRYALVDRQPINDLGTLPTMHISSLDIER